MASTMASDLELGCQVLFWLERMAFSAAYMSTVFFPASWCLSIMLSVAFQVMSFVRSSIQSDNPESKSDSWTLFTVEHVAAILLEAYWIFGRPPHLAGKAFLLFQISWGIRLLLKWWASHSGEVAKVWAEIIDEETEKTEEKNSVPKPVESKVEQEDARPESPEKETAEAEPSPALEEALGHREKTSEGHDDKLETASSAASCEANDEEVLNTSQGMSGSRWTGEATLALPTESEWVPPPATGDGWYHDHLQISGEEDRCSLGRGYYASPWAHERVMSGSGCPGEAPLAQPTESGWVPPPAPRDGLYHDQLQIRDGEDRCSLGRGYYANPWAYERVTSGSGCPGEAPLAQPTECGWVPPPAPGDGLHHDHLQIGGEEDCCSLGRGYYASPWAHERDYLLEELDKANGAVNSYQQLVAAYNEDFHQLTTENLQLASKLEDLTARYNFDWDAYCTEYYKECCLEYSEVKGLLLGENARLKAEVEELRRQLEESECKLQALETNLEENARLVAENEEPRKRMDKSEYKRQALEQENAHLDAMEENARLGAEMEELRKQLDESECKRQALKEENLSINVNLTSKIALCEVYCFLLQHISLSNRTNS